MRELEDVLQDWEAVIGLEVHTELTTLESKMFCGCKLGHDDEPNTNVCPVCLGMPGALPVPNRAAIESIVLAGLATGCDIEPDSQFYRKNYFYPDMSKNYQITQGPVAFCMRGHLDLVIDGPGVKQRLDAPGAPEGEKPGSYETRIGITRIHMEEDAGKLVHRGGTDGRISGASSSLVDYNRCGTPLIELVTEPDLRTPEEARRFMQKLRDIFLTLGISDCSMESGSMRCDGNVSIRRRGETEFGTKTELKNMNSFKNLHDGLSYEIRRQAEVLEEGGRVLQETRHWEPTTKHTISMRSKETAEDYRLFPDPDLSPFHLTEEYIDSIRARMPELPDARAARLVESFGITRSDAALIASEVAVAELFEAAVAHTPDAAQQIANLVNNVVAGLRNDDAVERDPLDMDPAHLAELARLLKEDVVSSNQGREILIETINTDTAPEAVADARGMKQVSDVDALLPIVREILLAHEEQAAQYREGNQKVIGYLVGQCMKASRGQGNPKLFNELLRQELEA